MSKTIVTHPNGERTVIRKTSGCGGCFWALLGAFVLFAPAVWMANGSIPAAVGVLMYVVLAAVLIAGITKQTKGRQFPAPPPPPPQ